VSWEMVPFESVYSEPSRNGIYKSAEHHGSGAKIVNMGELFAHEFIGAQEMARLSMSDAELEKAGLIDGDLLFGRRSLVESGAGKCSVVEGVTEPLTFESSIIRVRTDMIRVVPRFLYYWFKSRLGRGSIRAIVSGTNVKGIRGSDLKKVLVPLPSRQVQEAVAFRLSAYDDLIENNRRRIVLLEQSARLLYREWFVHLRFPGHEHVKVVDGVPKGWEICSLGDCFLIRKGKNITKNEVLAGAIPVVAAGLGPSCFHNVANAKGPVVTISASGANAGVVRLYAGDIWASDCSYISGDITDKLFYVYCLLKQRQNEITAMQKGAAQPHVYPKDIQGMRVLRAPEELICEFEASVIPTFRLMANLEAQNTFLANARDLLLPRLMSGDLMV